MQEIESNELIENEGESTENDNHDESDNEEDKEDDEIMNAEQVSDADLDKEVDDNLLGYSKKDEDFVNAALEEIDLGDME